jgi:hypothetical protein
MDIQFYIKEPLLKVNPIKNHPGDFRLERIYILSDGTIKISTLSFSHLPRVGKAKKRGDEKS